MQIQNFGHLEWDTNYSHADGWMCLFLESRKACRGQGAGEQLLGRARPALLAISGLGIETQDRSSEVTQQPEAEVRTEARTLGLGPSPQRLSSLAGLAGTWGGRDLIILPDTLIFFFL